MWLNGDADQPGAIRARRRGHAGRCRCGAGHSRGARSSRSHRRRRAIETSLLEVLIDFQFEVLTTYLNDGERPPRAPPIVSAHAYLSAPYGVYPTADGHIAIAMTPLPARAASRYRRPGVLCCRRQELVQRARRHQAHSRRPSGDAPTAHWLALLEPADIWCAKVLDWPELVRDEGFRVLDMLQTVIREDGVAIRTTRSPLRVDGARPQTRRAAPRIGEQSAAIRAEFGL